MMRKLKKIYHALPFSVRNAIGGIYGSLPENIRLGNAYGEMYQLLQKSDSWSQDEVREWQNRQLKQLLIHAYETTIFYHKQFQGAGFDPYKFRDREEMAQIPAIDKRTVQDNLTDMLSTAFTDKQRLKMTTGGTTGRQLIFYAQKRFTLAREKAYFDYLWGKAGYVPGKSERIILRNNVLPKGKLWQYDKKEKCLILDPFHMTDEICHKLIQKINDVHIPFFHVYLSSVLILADYMNRTGDFLKYRPQAIFASSENLYTGQREIVEKAFGCRMLLHYGHSEMCSVAGWCLTDNHYHLEELYGYTELLDEKQQVINAVDKMGEITATGFNNYVLPLIRYRTGDYAAYAESESDDCGFKGRILGDIEGRWRQEMLVTSQGNKISMTAINFHSDIFDHVRFYQFYQDAPGKVTMRIVKGWGYTKDDEQNIKNAVSEKLGEYLQMNIEYVEQIERAGNGKYRYIISAL